MNSVAKLITVTCAGLILPLAAPANATPPDVNGQVCRYFDEHGVNLASLVALQRDLQNQGMPEVQALEAPRLAVAADCPQYGIALAQVDRVEANINAPGI